MPALSIEAIFDAAVRIQLIEEKALSLNFSEDALSIKFPTTRRLAEFLDVPHYYVLPYFAMMEQDELVTRAERVGIMTTARGTHTFLSLMEERYREEAVRILGQVVFAEILLRAKVSPSEG